MKVVIDTNVLYYCSGLEQSDIDARKILSNLQQFDGVVLSEVSVIEMLVKYRNDHVKAIECINFIADQKFAVHQIEPDDNQIIGLANDQRILELDFFRDVTSRALTRKIRIEADSLTYLIGTILSLYLLYLLRVNPAMTDESRKVVAASSLVFGDQMLDKSSKFRVSLAQALSTYYSGQMRLGEKQLNTLLTHAIEESCHSFELAKTTTLTPEFKQAETREAFIRRLKSNSKTASVEVLRAAMRRMELDTLIGGGKDEKVLDAAMAAFIRHRSDVVEKNMSTYNLIVAKKVFRSKEGKIRVNDVFDSVLVTYLDEFPILTFDKELQKRIDLLNAGHAQVSRNFVVDCRGS